MPNEAVIPPRDPPPEKPPPRELTAVEKEQAQLLLYWRERQLAK